MKLTLRCTAIALVLTLTPAFAAERLLKTLSGALVLGKFNELDKNGDGKLTAEEAGNAPWFKRFDVNSDGVVTREEVREVIAAANRPAAAATAQTGAPTGIPAGSPEQLFKAADKNGDGKVTPDELTRPELFKLLDTNGDGVITLEEARPTLERWAKRTGPAGGSSATAGPIPLRQGPKILKPGDAGIGRMVPDVAFTDLSDVKHKLSDFRSAKGLAIAFTSTTCPVSKRYAPSLARLEAELRGKGVALLLVNPFSSEKPDVLRADVKAHGFTSPYVHDRDGSLVRALNARSTTEVFLLDGARTLIYRGALDDQYGLNHNLDAPNERYLTAAVDALLAGSRPAIAATEAPGCELDLPAAGAVVSGTPATYHRDVERILQQNCVQCHHDKGIAPFALNDLDEVKDRAKVIRRVVDQGTMPPWFAAPQPGDKESPWANDRSLSARDKADLLAWINSSDRPLGSPAEAPSAVKLPDDWTIGKPDLVVQLSKPFSIKADGFMPYQFTTVETTLTEDKWVQAYEIVPTAREVVHHVIVQVHKKGSLIKRGGEDGDGYWAAYVPGNTSHVYPDGFARKLPAGATVSFQIHYTPNGKATEDQLKMGLVFAKQPPKYAVHTVAVAGRKLSIPPGEANHVVTTQQPVPFDMNVTAYMAHMHVRGKAFKFEVTYPDGKAETLLDIPRYDFNWQLRYEYREPHVIPRGSTVKITAVYDNSPGNKANPDPTKTVRWGPQTVDEMMIGYIEHYTLMPNSKLAAASAAH